MLKHDSNTLNVIHRGNRDLVKLVKDGVVCYYKMVLSGGTPTQVPCYAVVDNISSYQDTEFEDVFDKSSETWYKRNNLNEYEEYGIYGSGRNITYYDGKLTIDGDYEYQYSGGSWVNLGEVTGSTRVPAEYTELTYAQTTKAITNSGNTFWIENDLEEDYKYTFEFTPLNWEDNYYGTLIGGNDNDPKFFYYGIFKLDNGWGDMTKRFVAGLHGYNVSSRGGYGGNYRVYTDVRSKFEMHLHNYNISEGVDITVYNEGYDTFTHTSTTKTGQTTNGVYDMPIFTQSINNGSCYTPALKFHDFKVETSGGTAVYDYIPVKRNSDNKVGLYDVVNNRVYIPSAITLTAGEEATHTTYPKYYDTIDNPPSSVSFSSMTEAQQYECPYVGLQATIDGTNYVFAESGGTYYWEELTTPPLPNIPFVINYNAKNYNSDTKTFAKTEGQLADTDITITTGTVTPHDDYVTVPTRTKGVISGYDSYFNRTNGQTFTIISKHKTTDDNTYGCHLLANRNTNYNWMYRPSASTIRFHGSTQINGVSVTTQPVIASVRVSSDNTLKFDNWTDKTSTTSANFNWGSLNSGGVALFAGYVQTGREYFVGDFYWIYVSQNELTDEQIQQVINYNEQL